jgi:hypothetical protein
MNINETDFYWLAGLHEAEGSFIAPPPSSPNTPRISISMTDEDIIAQVARIIEAQYPNWEPTKENYKTAYLVNIKGYRAADLMHALYPLMSKRRQRQIDVALQNYVYKPNKKGQNNGQSKLMDEQVCEIKRRLANGETQASIAVLFQISQRAVSDIKCGKTWAHIKVDAQK